VPGSAPLPLQHKPDDREHRDSCTGNAFRIVLIDPSLRGLFAVASLPSGKGLAARSGLGQEQIPARMAGFVSASGRFQPLPGSASPFLPGRDTFVDFHALRRVEIITEH